MVWVLSHLRISVGLLYLSVFFKYFMLAVSEEQRLGQSTVGEEHNGSPSGEVIRANFSLC